jgi:hypothetical protein
VSNHGDLKKHASKSYFKITSFWLISCHTQVSYLCFHLIYEDSSAIIHCITSISMFFFPLYILTVADDNHILISKTDRTKKKPWIPGKENFQIYKYKWKPLYFISFIIFIIIYLLKKCLKTDRTGKHEFRKKNYIFPKDKIIVKN